MFFDRIPWTTLFNTLMSHPVKISVIITANVIVISIIVIVSVTPFFLRQFFVVTSG